ncbi:MAG: aminopeptidase P family protein [Phycisphaerae bacterium]
MKPPIRDRLRRLRRAFREKRVDAFLVTHPVDVGYLSGFTGDSSWLLVLGRSACLITDSRFSEQAERECPHLSRTVRRGPPAKALALRLRRSEIARLGFDPESVTVALRRRLRGRLKGVRLVAMPGLVGRLRLLKDASEQRVICRAVRVAEEAWATFRKRIRTGMTERRLAAELDHRMRLAGADGPAFPTICAVDASSSMPHAKAGARRLRRGSVLLVDFGARVGGYVSDLTRVLFAGRISPRAREVYEVVRAAQEAAMARIGPGAGFRDVDAAARSVIEEAGLGAAFGHGTGHGIGREVHEPPTLAPLSKKGTLEAGMVVTVEPGVYRKGRFGIRIEDDCLVTRTGRRVLSRLEKDLEAMVL